MMIDLLKGHIERSVDPNAPFMTSGGLPSKVDGDGKLLPFYGNTAVFLLDEGVKKKLYGLQDELYAAAGGMLADRLEMDTFHMTLHDLANGTRKDGALAGQMEWMEREAKRALSGWYDVRPIQMRATWMFNMVNTSVVLGLEPVEWDDSFWRLEQLYGLLQGVRPLNYAMTPHITLAYYKPLCDGYGPAQAAALAGALRKVELDVTLRMEDLVIQEFTSMNHYQTV